MKFVIFALIPLILSIGLIPAFPFSDAAEDNQICIDKVWIENTKGKIACVTSSTADKLVERGWGTLLEISMEEPIEEELPLGIEKIETRSGTITIDHDYFTPESAKLLSDELFFQRAVQVYHLALPAVGGAGIFNGVAELGAGYNDVIYWSDFMTSDFGLLTPNASVLYFMSMYNLSDGPIVVENPCCVMGAFNNIYQQTIADVGTFGPFEGEAGAYLIIPPNYDEEIPENYAVVQSDTMQGYFIARSFVNDDDKSAARDLILETRIYPLSESENPPEQTFIDFSGKSAKLSHPTTEGYWEFLHNVYSNETIVREEDKNLIGLMHAIGIIPGEPFAPDDHSKEILDKAAIVADLMARNIAYDSPVKENFIYYPDKHWELGFMTDNPDFEDNRGATQIEPRLSFAYQAITTSESMVLNIEGSGSKYLMNYRDADGNFLEGSNSYRLTVPANVPAENFWSVIAYDAETRSMIVNDQRPRSGFSSVHAEQYTQNPDGSYDVYFGQEAPEGFENNLINTNEGDGWFVIFRFYSPSAEYFDKSWELPNIEKIE